MVDRPLAHSANLTLVKINNSRQGHDLLLQTCLVLNENLDLPQLSFLLKIELNAQLV